MLVVHGLGRFVYTPLLPWLVEDGLLTVQEGASIASWNYLGYLIGALLAVRWHRVAQIRRSLPWALALHVLSSLLQTQAESPMPSPRCAWPTASAMAWCSSRRPR